MATAASLLEFEDVPLYKYPKDPFVLGQTKVTSCPASTSTLRQVFVVARHGARFPLHGMKEELSWPDDGEFWTNYKGHLTPIGCAQIAEVGMAMKARYVDTGFVSPSSAHEDVFVLTSNTQRSLQTAFAFTSAFLSTVPTCLIYDGDKIERLRSQLSLPGIGIHVDFQTASALLKQTKISQTYGAWKKKSFNSPSFLEWAKDAERVAFVSKLWDMTNLHKIEPSNSKRMTGMQTLRTQISLEEVHGMNTLPCRDGLVLSAREHEMLSEMSCHIWHCKFQGHSPQMQHEGGRLGAGFLGHEIGRSMSEKVAELKGATSSSATRRELPLEKFSFYSAHDGTILALLSHFGIRDPPIPSFASCMIFELHQDSESNFTVETLYVNDPFVNGIDRHSSLVLPLHDIVSYRDLVKGSTSADHFIAFTQLKGISLAQAIFLKSLERVRTRSTSTFGRAYLAVLASLQKKAMEGLDKSKFVFFAMADDGDE